MAAFAFDASAIVKRYIQETGSGWIQALADPAAGHEVFLTRVGRVEVTAAVTRRSRGGLLPGVNVPALLAQFRYDAAYQYNILEVIPAVLAEAERLAEVHGLRGYDAVQLATTMSLHRSRESAGLSILTFVSADGALNKAAQAEGLAVDDPTSHP